MWLMESFETVSLNQFDDPAETRLHVVRQHFEFFSNAVVQQLYDPRHLLTLLQFCNIRKGFVPPRDARRAVRVRQEQRGPVRILGCLSSGFEPERERIDLHVQIEAVAGLV